MSDFPPKREAPQLRKPLSDRIHDAIKERIADHRFSQVKYKDGLRKTWHSTSKKAKTILVRSLTRSFVPSGNRGCGGRLFDRSEWVWTALVAFDQTVSLDNFEDAMLRDPILILRDEELDQQVTISLTDVVESHPPESESSQGTRVTYRLLAELSSL